MLGARRTLGIDLAVLATRANNLVVTACELARLLQW